MSLRIHPIKQYLQDWFQSYYSIKVKFKTARIEQMKERNLQPALTATLPQEFSQRNIEEEIQWIPKSIPFVKGASIEKLDDGDDLFLWLNIDKQVFFNDTINNLKQGMETLPQRCKWNPNQGMKQIVEFSSPNIAKPFHCGHLRSTIIGNVVANVKNYLGNDVIKLNYLGDWGTQFGILSHGFDKFGNEEDLKLNPIQHLFEVYVKANRMCEEDENFRKEAKEKFSQMEKGLDEHESKKWDLFRKYSIKEYNKIYRELGIEFNEFHFESMYSQSAHLCVEHLEKRGLIETLDDGAKLISLKFGDQESSTPLVKSDGSSLYLTRDIAAAIERKEKYGFNEMYYVVGRAQTKHFQSLKAILEKMGHEWSKNLHHISFGVIRGMSTRRGELIFLEDIINEARHRCKESTIKSATTKSDIHTFDQLSSILGLSALFIHDLKHPKGRDYNFNWDEALTLKGYTGVGLQYAHARICSIERLCQVELDLDVSLNLKAVEGEAWERLFLQLSRFEDILEETSLKCEPSILVRYLLWLSRFNNTCIESYKVKGEPLDIAQTRLLVYHCCRKIIKKGLNLVGLEALDQI